MRNGVGSRHHGLALQTLAKEVKGEEELECEPCERRAVTSAPGSRLLPFRPMLPLTWQEPQDGVGGDHPQLAGQGWSRAGLTRDSTSVPSVQQHL